MTKILKNEKLKDILPISILILVYTIISFIRLGSTINPQTFETITNGSSVIFELSGPNKVYNMRYFLGDREGKYNAYGSEDGIEYIDLGELEGGVLSWNDLRINPKYKFVKITSTSNKNGNIGEVAFLDTATNKVDVSLVSDIGTLLLDEPETVPEIISCDNSTYFDEIYFATSAHEFVNGEPATEYTHPHLGKILQSIPVALFGTTPFSYRLMGNLAGIAIVLVMYLLAKLLFKNRLLAFLPAFLMAFDNFHFAQTRMGTVDSFLILFCLLSTFFMYKYFLLKSDAPLKKKLFNLFFCGLFLGLAICVKWMGFYAGLGLALIFFGKMIYDSIKQRKFNKQNFIIILACILFFVIIPAIIYVSLYFCFETVHGKINTLDDFFKLTYDMYDFHSTLTATHPFSSSWYTWPITLKPVWFYVANINNAATSTLSNLGNPAIWWFSVIALIFLLGRAVIKRQGRDIFIIVMYLAVWLPYIFIGRVMFLYHYFMALPFAMFAVSVFFEFLLENTQKKWIIWLYMILVFVMFWVFYPISSGAPVPKIYINSLRWFETWIF